jgi:Mn2+/Fe2+ NRAMP family transporter
MATTDQVDGDRKLLADAQSRGLRAQLSVFFKLSGPGWLQSAITLGGGSLSGALFLGILGGNSLLWLQLVAIAMGVIMLSAISYVTLSTGQRPFGLINRHINPVLGWGWIIATILANMIWCMPQFSLCYAALEKNLVSPEMMGAVDSTVLSLTNGGGAANADVPGSIGQETKLIISLILLAAAAFAVVLNQRGGKASKLFDLFLKVLIGIVVVCFVGVVSLLTFKGQLNWGAITAGFVPDLSTWSRPTGALAALITGLPPEAQEFWTDKIVLAQRDVMTAAAATAVGINMTFLMPYALLKRGWDKTFRGLARFDLSTGMAIPYVLVTSCVVIAAGSRFHATADAEFLSSDPTIMQTSPLFNGARGTLAARLQPQLTAADTTIKKGEPGFDEATARIATAAADLPESERLLAAALVKRSGFDLSGAIAPLLGRDVARIAFGLGIFGMGFSSIIILMLINGFAFCELANRPNHKGISAIGCIVAGISGAMWPMFWKGDTQFYLAIVASTFGAMLLPIAYFTFFLMLNSRTIMGNEKPTGIRLMIWNVLMAVSVAGAVAAAWTAISAKVSAPNAGLTGNLVLAGAIGYIVLVIVGFVLKRNSTGHVAADDNPIA